jgi:ferredoxin-type protein NapH
LLFPITMNYFSPYVIIDGATNGVINGSFIIFVSMFLSSLLVGRLWCGWLCPAAGLEEACFAINDQPARGGKLDWIKWAIWVVWVGVIAAVAISAGGYRQIDFLYLTESGISVTEPFQYITYCTVLGFLMILPVLFGKRAACHYLCWMAPFMILGRSVRNLFRWPSLCLRAEMAKCIDCKRCTRACPMSLDVNQMVRDGAMENSECILCGSCVDTCPKDVLAYTFQAGK